MLWSDALLELTPAHEAVQAYVLRCHDSPGGSATPEQIAHTCGLSGSKTQALLDDLEAVGMVSVSHKLGRTPHYRVPQFPSHIGSVG